MLHEGFTNAIAHVAAARPDGEFLVVSHGDFSPRNVLDGAESLVLIDFDRLQMAGPGRDVGYLAAWCWATNAQRGGVGSWALGDAFASAYARCGGLAISPTAMSFHRACALLRIASSWTALADQPLVASRIIEEAVSQLEVATS